MKRMSDEQRALWTRYWAGEKDVMKDITANISAELAARTPEEIARDERHEARENAFYTRLDPTNMCPGCGINFNTPDYVPTPSCNHPEGCGEIRHEWEMIESGAYADEASL